MNLPMYLLMAIIGLTSIAAFSNEALLQKLELRIGSILSKKEYSRILTAGFVHVNWMHLGFNLLTLYFFSSSLLQILSWHNWILIYICSLIVGNLLSIYIHRNHEDYRAVGASGAISGLVYAFIAIDPQSNLSFLFLPGISFPAWILGIGYMIYTMYSIRKQNDNIGHEAHFGGAIAGLICIIFIDPSAILNHFWIPLILILPAVVFLYFVFKKPELLFSMEQEGSHLKIIKSTPIKVPQRKRVYQLDELLDKINSNGIENLSKAEKEALEKLSKK